MLNFPLKSAISEDQPKFNGNLDKVKKGISVSTFVSTLRYLLKNDFKPHFPKKGGQI